MIESPEFGTLDHSLCTCYISGTWSQLSIWPLAAVLLTAIQHWRVPIYVAMRRFANVRAMKCPVQTYHPNPLWKSLQMGSILIIGKTCPYLPFIILVWMTWFLSGSKCKDMEFQSEQGGATEIKDLLCSKSTKHCAMVQNAEHYEWNVMRKMLKHHAQSIETLFQNIMLKATEVVIYIMLQSGNVHTHSTSKLYDHTQSSG